MTGWRPFGKPVSSRGPEPSELLPAPSDAQPWWKKKRFSIPLGTLLAVFLLGAIAGDPPEDESIRTEDRLPRATTTSRVVERTTTSTSTTTTTAPPTTTTSPPTTPPPTAGFFGEPEPKPQQSDCHPSYPDFCIPPPPPDLDCGDVNGKRFTVRQPDPHKFDQDGDGIGCES